MGAGGSSLVKGNVYSKRAEESEARLLADKILDVFFKNADFKDLLNLSSIQGCPAYVFTTAEALKGMFQTLKVEPKFGKKGEILFAPVSKLAPGLVKGKEMDEKLRVLTEERNKQCMDVAYFYVRIFQIYAALALTVLDANPVRRSRSISYTTSGQKPGRTIFTGGALTLTQQKPLENSIFAPFIKIPFISKNFEIKDSYLIYNNNKFRFAIPIPKSLPSYSTGSEYVTSDFIIRTTDGKIIDKSVIQNIIFKIIDSNTLEIQIGNISIIRVKFEYGTYTISIYDTVNGNFKDIETIDSFQREISSAIEPYSTQVNQQTSGQSSVSSSSVARGIITAPSGKSVFTGFEDMKKVLEQRFTGKGYPKAYCIARAMTLLNPIFDSERLNPNQPFITQICSKVFDFEVGGIDAMPRLDRPPNANLYFKSLIALYYDDYKLNRDGTFSQSQTIPGKDDLINASRLIAALYGIDDKEGKFLESSTRFPRLKVCEKEGYLAIKDKKLTSVLQKDIIMPMIQFQEEHTKKVNAFFKKMFEFKDGNFRFSGQLREGGNEAVRNVSREAASLLLDYYLRSEAYYIKGSRIIEQNKALVESVV